MCLLQKAQAISLLTKTRHDNCFPEISADADNTQSFKKNHQTRCFPELFSGDVHPGDESRMISSDSDERIEKTAVFCTADEQPGYGYKHGV